MASGYLAGEPWRLSRPLTGLADPLARVPLPAFGLRAGGGCLHSNADQEGSYVMFAFLSRVRPVMAAIAVLVLGTTDAAAQSGGPVATRLVSGLEGAVGSTVGPDGALYVTEGTAGRISRVEPTTGAVSTFATGLPRAIFPIGGPID